MNRLLMLWCASAALGIALLMAGSVSIATATWGSPRVLNHDVLNVKLAGNAGGAQGFLWTAHTEKGVQIGQTRWGVSYPRARLRLPDGRLTRPQTLTRTRGISAGAQAIGLDRRGAATALWTEARPRYHSLRVSLRSPGGRFGAGAEVGRMSLSEADEVALEVAPDGAAVIVWVRGSSIYVLRRPAGRCRSGSRRACFGSRQRIPARCPSGLSRCVEDWHESLALAIGPHGRAYLAWTAVHRAGDAFRTVIRLAVAPAAGRFGRPRIVSRADEVSTEPAIAIARDGGAVLAWVGHRPGSPRRIVAAVSDPRGHVPAPPQTLSPGGCDSPMLRINSNDETTAAWTCRYAIGAAVRPASGTFVPTPIPDAGVTSVALALDGHANTLLMYVAGEKILTRVRPPGQGFGEPTPVGEGNVVRAAEAGRRLSMLRPGKRPNTSLLSDWTP